eukprot:4660131-Pyramimonas_sp.AAC.1
MVKNLVDLRGGGMCTLAVVGAWTTRRNHTRSKRRYNGLNLVGTRTCPSAVGSAVTNRSKRTSPGSLGGSSAPGAPGGSWSVRSIHSHTARHTALSTWRCAGSVARPFNIRKASRFVSPSSVHVRCAPQTNHRFF